MDSMLNLMKNRRSVREFSNKPVTMKTLEKILEAATVAPSGAGIFGTHIIVVDDVETRKKLRMVCEQGEKEWVESQPKVVKDKILELAEFSFKKEYIETAPVLLVITTRPRDPEIPYAVESAFLTVGYLLVMIQGLGLGTVTYTPSIAHESEEKILDEIIGLPEGETIQVILPIGYPKTKPKPKAAKGFLNVYHNQFDQPFEINT